MDAAVPGGAGANGQGAGLGVGLDGDAPVLVRIGPPGAAADLEAALEGLDPVRCAVVRIGNPLKAPLDPQRVMLQLAPHDEGGSGPGQARGDEAGRLLRTVVDRAAGRPSLLVVVEQAETLTPAALALLRLLPGLRGAGVPSIRVAFYGTPAFRALLDDAPVRDHDAATLPPLSPPRPPRRYRRGAVLGVAAVAIPVLLLATLLPFRGTSPGTSPVSGVPVAPASPSPPPAAAAAPVPAAQAAPAAGIPAVVPPDIAAQSRAATPLPATPPPATAESPVAARARLFREFNAFVEARGLAGRLSRSEREALFEEYLVRRSVATGVIVPTPGAPSPSIPASAGAADPAPLPASAPEVVVFFHAGRAGAEARAGESAVLLRQWAADVTVRPAPDGPAEPTVRYYRPEDRSLALSLAFALPSATPDWQLVDLSGAADRPLRPTIEVWLPGAP